MIDREIIKVLDGCHDLSGIRNIQTDKWMGVREAIGMVNASTRET